MGDEELFVRSEYADEVRDHALWSSGRVKSFVCRMTDCTSDHCRYAVHGRDRRNGDVRPVGESATRETVVLSRQTRHPWPHWFLAYRQQFLTALGTNRSFSVILKGLCGITTRIVTVHLCLVSKDFKNSIDFNHHDIPIFFTYEGLIYFFFTSVLSNRVGTDLSEKRTQSEHELISHWNQCSTEVSKIWCSEVQLWLASIRRANSIRKSLKLTQFIFVSVSLVFVRCMTLFVPLHFPISVLLKRILILQDQDLFFSRTYLLHTCISTWSCVFSISDHKSYSSSKRWTYSLTSLHNIRFISFFLTYLEKTFGFFRIMSRKLTSAAILW